MVCNVLPHLITFKLGKSKVILFFCFIFKHLIQLCGLKRKRISGLVSTAMIETVIL